MKRRSKNLTFDTTLLLPSLLLSLVLFVLTWSSCEESDACTAESISMPGEGICLIFEDGGELENGKNSIRNVLAEAITEVNSVMPLGNLMIRVKTDLNFVIPELGFGGYVNGSDEIIIAFDPGFSQLSNSIENQLASILAHEMHHIKRIRALGYGSTLLEACITEGMADHFSMELYGIDPPMWSMALTEEQRDDWIQTAEASWNSTSYDHNEWFFGMGSIPRWTGYSIGFELVQNYLLEHPDELPSSLYDESADSFRP